MINAGVTGYVELSFWLSDPTLFTGPAPSILTVPSSQLDEEEGVPKIKNAKILISLGRGTKREREEDLLRKRTLMII